MTGDRFGPGWPKSLILCLLTFGRRVGLPTVVSLITSEPHRGKSVSIQLSPVAWQLQAACRGPQSEVFFPPSQSERKHDRLERERRAKAICGICPVRSDCLSYAMEIRESHGIWGGLSESERKSMMERQLAAS